MSDSPPKKSAPVPSNELRVARAEFVAGAALAGQVPPTKHFEDAPEIAFAGRSNVGKSSLLNMLLQRRGLARTSNTPGRTRQINFFDVSLAKSTREADATRPERIVFVDLPGYGYAKVSKSESGSWGELLESYLRDRPTLRAVVILVDIRRGLEAEEEELRNFLDERPAVEVIIVATKIDKLPRNAQKPALAKFSQNVHGKVVATSAETSVGRDLLWARIFGACARPLASKDEAAP